MAADLLTRPDLDRPAPRPAVPSVPAPVPAAVGHQLLVHRLGRRELALLADLAGWAAPDDAGRAGALGRHADLVARVLLAHHAGEREVVWPALLDAVAGGPAAGDAAVAVGAWTAATRHLDQRLGDLRTAGRQWAVARSRAARDAFARAAAEASAALEQQVAAEEAVLVPLLGEHLDRSAWAAVRGAASCSVAPADRMLVLGLALEDAGAAERARVLAGLPRATRLHWRLTGAGRYRAAVVRLRGAPPAA